MSPRIGVLDTGTATKVPSDMSVPSASIDTPHRQGNGKGTIGWIHDKP